MSLFSQMCHETGDDIQEHYRLLFRIFDHFNIEFAFGEFDDVMS